MPVPSIISKVNTTSIGASIKLAEKTVDAALIAGALAGAQRLRDTIVYNASRATPAAPGQVRERGRENTGGDDPELGPALVDGDYVRSWQVQPVGSAANGRTSYAVFSRHPSAHRLEFGFTGVDKPTGRKYTQPPFPHVQVSIDEARDGILADMAAPVAAVLA